jgi:hypothetical protein
LAAGPVNILVPDFNDPCGMGKIPRALAGSYSADVQGTVGRWMLSFGEPYLHPVLLVTAADHRYEVTALPAGPVGGPCAACRSHAEWEQREREAAGSAPVESEQDTLIRLATGAGREHGWDHANYVDNVSGVDGGWSVPDRFVSVATYYEAAFAEGMEKYRETDEWLGRVVG